VKRARTGRRYPRTIPKVDIANAGSACARLRSPFHPFHHHSAPLPPAERVTVSPPPAACSSALFSAACLDSRLELRAGRRRRQHTRVQCNVFESKALVWCAAGGSHGVVCDRGKAVRTLGQSCQSMKHRQAYFV
jgi:hypothetical protein